MSIKAPAHISDPTSPKTKATAKAHHYPPDSAGKRNKEPKEGEALEDVDPTDYDPRAAPEGTPIGYPDTGDRYPTEGLPYPDPDKVPPALTSITPTGAVVGDPVLTLHAMGTAFGPAARIVFNGAEVGTAYVSDTELTTDLDPATLLAGPIPVLVRSPASGDTAAQTFTVTDPATRTTAKK